MKSTERKRLYSLETAIEALRAQLRISARGETLFHAPKSMWSATDVIVEADGNGGAKLLIVEGNYPADYTTYKEQQFHTEEEACERAEQLIEGKKVC